MTDDTRIFVSIELDTLAKMSTELDTARATRTAAQARATLLEEQLREERRKSAEVEGIIKHLLPKISDGIDVSVEGQSTDERDYYEYKRLGVLLGVTT